MYCFTYPNFIHKVILLLGQRGSDNRGRTVLPIQFSADSWSIDFALGITSSCEDKCTISMLIRSDSKLASWLLDTSSSNTRLWYWTLQVQILGYGIIGHSKFKY